MVLAVDKIMIRLIRVLSVAGALLGADPAQACTCLPGGPPCAAYWEVAAVFVGRVESIDSVAENRPGGTRVVRFAVTESFRGVSDSVVNVRTGRGGGDCGYRFKEGAEYFVYAYRQDGSGDLATGICTRTRTVEDAGADLAYARALARGNPPAGRISGQLMLHHRRAGGVPARPPEPLDGIPVVLESERQTLRGVTDRYGTFEFVEPATATYTVRLELPDGYYAGHIPPVRLAERQACADVPIAVYYDGRILGRVLDASGDPVAGLTLELTSDEGSRGAREPLAPILTRGDGSFEFSRVPPGRYAIGVSTHHDPAAAAGNMRALHDGRFAVTPGGRLTVPDFVIPASVRYVRVYGVVLDADGYFAADARVYLAGPNEGDALFGIPAITDASGRFELAALAGREYRLLAERASPRDAGSRVDASDPVRVTASADPAPVRIRLRVRH